MLDAFRLLRFRLTMLYVLVFGVLQALLWIGVDIMRTNLLLGRVDRLLLARGQALTQAIDDVPHAPDDADAIARIATLLESFQLPDTAFQVRLSDGQTLARSQNLRGLNLPFEPSSELVRAQVADLRTVKGEIARLLGDADAGLRLLTLFHAPPQRPATVIQVSADLGPMERELTEIRQLLVLFGFISLVLAAITSWYMANRALAPIGQIARQARQLSADRLEQRIPRPHTTGEVAELVTVINEMLDRLQAQFREQEHFIAQVSHEMRTPLAILRGEASALERGGMAPDQVQGFLTSLQEETRRLLRTVDSFLALTRVRTGGRAVVAAEVAMDEVVMDAVRACRREADERQVRLVPRIEHADGSGDPIVRGDADLLRSMVENLVHNAVRHSPPEDSVEVTVSPNQREVAVEVRDRGPGLPEEELARVFEPYYRADSGHRKAGLAGLGLSIARRVAEFYGGVVEARNQPDGGCAFTVRLPLAH